MRATNFLPLLYLSAASAFVVKRDVNLVVNDFQQIAAQSDALAAQVNAFNGGILGIGDALAIQGKANDLDTQVKKTNSDTAALPKLGDTDSASIATAVTGIQSSIFGALDAIVAKHDQFESVPLAIGLVQNSLKTLRNDSAVLGQTATSKLVTLLQKIAPLVTDDIDYHFQRAVQAYNS